VTGDGKKWSGNEIRETFLKFFESKGHRRVRSSSLVPHGDPTLLFTNAGMNQFKDVFLGLEKRDYNRATTAQKCVRAGGKHNDLENVGFTKRHHTFFEMMGNFSFGDYFKKDAIAYAWELITSPDWYGIPKEKLYATIFEGSNDADAIPFDEEAKKCWMEQGVSQDRIFALGKKDNFWQMGDTGPCGPCSEIHYDIGALASEHGHTDCKFPCDCGRYVEIWNLVFMQYNREIGSYEGGKTYTLSLLPKPSVDTGMGLERVAAVLQGVISNYDTDLFVPLIEAAAKLAGANLKKELIVERNARSAGSLRVIADHARATTFLISDGILPSNDGRGYVLRKILRRAINHSRKLGATGIVLAPMAGVVAAQMQVPYPELTENLARIEKIIEIEEQRFDHTVSVGDDKSDDVTYEYLEKRLKEYSGTQEILDKSRNLDLGLEEWNLEADKLSKKGRIEKALALWHSLPEPKPKLVFPGDKAFKLYDTYGLPLDFMIDGARDRGIEFDLEGFDAAMKEQRTRARASWKGAHKDVANPAFAKLAETFKTEPDFYYGSATRDCHVEAIITKNGSVKEIAAGMEAEIVLDRSSIYSESGGQVADVGKLYDNAESIELATVRGAYYPVAGLIAHRVTAIDTIRVGDRVATVADGARREHIKRNHTATHLMNAALRNILGTHVKQAGSLVEPGRLRFDFSHFAPVDSAELRDIEQQVNEEILLNNELETNIMPLDEALASGALAFFGDRYPETNVRVVTIPDANSPRGFFSKELCGGTHVKRSGDIGIFKIVGESSVAAGVRRIEAISGVRALEEYQLVADSLRSLATTLNVGPEELESAAQKLIEGRRDLEKQLNTVQKKSAQGSADELIAQSRHVKGVKVVASRVPDMSREALRGLVDTLKQKLGSGVIALGMVESEKVAMIVGVTKDLTAKCNAGKIIQAIAKEVGGSGGGRPDLAEAGGKDTSALNMALEMVPAIVDRML